MDILIGAVLMYGFFGLATMCTVLNSFFDFKTASLRDYGILLGCFVFWPLALPFVFFGLFLNRIFKK